MKTKTEVKPTRKVGGFREVLVTLRYNADEDVSSWHISRLGEAGLMGDYFGEAELKAYAAKDLGGEFVKMLEALRRERLKKSGGLKT